MASSNNHSFHSEHSQHSLNQSFQNYQKSSNLSFPLNVTQNLAFNNSNQDYVVTIEATDERVTIIVEDRFDINTWRGDFTSMYIQEITKKTGKERTYSTFMQMLVGTIQNQKGFSQFYIDIMGFQELQLLKAKRGGDEKNQPAMQTKNNKKYLILTHLMNGNKVHYPLPLNPVETGAYLMDKETMQRMVKRMSQTLSDFRNMNATGGGSQSNQSNGFSMNSNQNQLARQTAKEFFSKENVTHPVVEENMELKKKLQQLEQARTMGGAVSLNTLHIEKKKVDQDFHSYQVIIQKEIKKLKNLKNELQRKVNETKNEIQSERPQSAYSQLSMGGMQIQNQTITSNFNTNNSLVNEVEELRRQLSEVSVDLEETRDQYKKKLALQSKDMEDYYEQLSSFRHEEKSLRVKVNQIEVELEHNLKRLDIICKSKGLPRPKRRTASNASGGRVGGSSYTSPYRQGSQNGSANKNNTRGLSNNSANKRPSPFRNQNYTPPNKRNISPGNMSNGSNNKFRSSPLNTGLSNNAVSLKNRQNSPGNRSNFSNNSSGSKTHNRLYSPSGRIRNNSGPGSNLYGSNAQAANRVRREPAVGGSGSIASRSNSRTKTDVPARVNTGLRNNSAGKTQLQKKTLTNTYGNRQPSSNNRPSAAVAQPRKTTLFGGGSKTAVLDQQKANGTIDQKIEKLQSMLKAAKGSGGL